MDPGSIPKNSENTTTYYNKLFMTEAMISIDIQ